MKQHARSGSGLAPPCSSPSQVAAQRRPLPIPGDGVAPAADLPRRRAPGARAMRAAAGESRRQGGEGDEGGRRQGVLRRELQPAVHFYRDIEMIRGHLLVGDELIEEAAGRRRCRTSCTRRRRSTARSAATSRPTRWPPFLAALKALAQTVKAKNKGAYTRARRPSKSASPQPTRASRQRRRTGSPSSSTPSSRCCSSAAGEYEEAIAKGRIAKPVEYQDSRGFVWQAERLFGTVAEGDRGRRTPRPLKGAQAAFADLKKAWPAPVPPKTPVQGRIAGARRRVEDRAAARAIPVNVDHEGCSSGAISQALILRCSPKASLEGRSPADAA